jgi:transcriptional regulator GlxA family with amidase domain
MLQKEKDAMNSRLHQIQNWAELARQANWSVAALAKKCGVTVRTLHRHFHDKLGRNTKGWLAEQRQRQALELLCLGSSVKETASSLGYKQPTNFTREYKKYWGFCPSVKQSNAIASRTANVRK